MMVDDREQILTDVYMFFIRAVSDGLFVPFLPCSSVLPLGIHAIYLTDTHDMLVEDREQPLTKICMLLSLDSPRLLRMPTPSLFLRSSSRLTCLSFRHGRGDGW